VFRIKYQEAFSYKPNADTSHLLDSLVSALAVYATAFRSKLSLGGDPDEQLRLSRVNGGNTMKQPNPVLRHGRDVTQCDSKFPSVSKPPES